MNDQPAASVKRLHPSLGDTWGMRASDDGEYVAYTDYAAAVAERDALEKGLAKMSEMYAELREQAERTMKDLVRESKESNRLRHDNAALREQVERQDAAIYNVATKYAEAVALLREAIRPLRLLDPSGESVEVHYATDSAYRAADFLTAYDAEAGNGTTQKIQEPEREEQPEKTA